MSLIFQTCLTKTPFQEETMMTTTTGTMIGTAGAIRIETSFRVFELKGYVSGGADVSLCAAFIFRT